MSGTGLENYLKEKESYIDLLTGISSEGDIFNPSDKENSVYTEGKAVKGAKANKSTWYRFHFNPDDFTLIIDHMDSDYVVQFDLYSNTENFYPFISSNGFAKFRISE